MGGGCFLQKGLNIDAEDEKIWKKSANWKSVNLVVELKSNIYKLNKDDNGKNVDNGLNLSPVNATMVSIEA